MNDESSARPAARYETRLTAIIFLIVAVFLVSAAALNLLAGRAMAYRQMEEVSLSQVQLVARTVENPLSEVDTLLEVIAGERARYADPPNDEALRELLRSWLLYRNQVANAAFYDSTGRRTAVLRRGAPDPPGILPEAVSENRTPGTPIVQLGEDGNRYLLFSRPVSNGGTVAALVSERYLQERLQTTLGPAMGGALLDGQGEIITRWPSDENDIERLIAGRTSARELDTLFSEQVGRFVVAGDQLRRWPFAVVMIISPDYVLRQWRSRVRTEIGFVVLGLTVLGILLVMVHRRHNRVRLVQAEIESARELARHRKMLVRETHHRVKNNLAVIESLLSLEANRAHDQSTRSLITGLHGRISSIALLHASLYQTDSLSELPFDQYCRTLLDQIRHAYDSRETAGSTEVLVDVPAVALPVDTVKRLGLILHELAANAFKYARSDGRVRLAVRFRERTYSGSGPSKDAGSAKDGGESFGADEALREFELLVEDNGPGLPDDAITAASGSIGYILVNALVGELQGRLEHWNEDGAHVRVVFPAPGPDA